MIEFKEALEIIINNTVQPELEKVSLGNAHNRVLAEDVYSDVALPPFDKSAMDGFACRSRDISNSLEIIATIAAGQQPQKTIGANQCAKIMTGAVVPYGADCVVMKEYAVEKDGEVSFSIGKSKSNICYMGEDVQIGDLVLPKNTLLSPRHIPVLAGAGITEPMVYKQPIVTVFATGSELVEPNQKPLSFQIRNSNSSQMMAQLDDLEIKGNYGGIIGDVYEDTKNNISLAFENSDVVILSGGVSEGDFDFIPSVMNELGFELLVTRVAIQPGKPILFARKENKYCFGLSGNPVSSFIQFELFLKPFLHKMMGYNFEPEIVQARLTHDFYRKKNDRLKLSPVYLANDKTLKQVEFHGSAHINSFVNANGLMIVPRGVSELKKGEIVNVRRL